MSNQLAVRIQKDCLTCASIFMVGGRSGALSRKYCSRACVIKSRIGLKRSLKPTGRWSDERHARAALARFESNAAPRAQVTPSLSDLTWAAGFYEGEGSCQRLGREQTHIHIGQKDRWPLEQIQKLFGGYISESSMNGSPFFDWHANGPRARGILMTMYPFLSPRRQEQARTAWESHS